MVAWSIDIAAKATPPLISGDSRLSQTFTDVTREIAPEESVMVLDSNHSRAHVLRAAALGAPRAQGHYVIVEDTNMNLRLAVTGRGPHPGAFEAVQEFLAEQDRFEMDRSREKFLLTWNPCGYCAAWLIPPDCYPDLSGRN